MNYTIVWGGVKRLIVPFYLFLLYLTNRLITYIPICTLRKNWYRLFGMKIGFGSQIDMGQYILSPFKIRIGRTSHINQGCIIDGREGIYIGNNVSISHRCSLMTGSHDINSKNFSYKGGPIIIGDNVFIGVNSIILPGVTIGKGAVICAGACITKNVPEYGIVAGIPAKIIGTRRNDLDYSCKPDHWFL